MAIRWNGLALLALISLALNGCSTRIEGKDVVSQAQSTLSKAYPSCSLAVSFKGIGEGDSDNAYALVTLASGKGENPVDAEVLLSRLNSGRWQITQQSSQQLVRAAKEICT